MSDVAITAVLAGLAALIPVLAGALVLLLNVRHKNRQDRERTALEQYREVADRQQRWLEQRDAHIVELSGAFDDLSEEHAGCQVEVAELYGHLTLMHDFAARLARSLRRLPGAEDPGEVPAMPPRRPRPDRSAAEFRRRQLQQSTQLIQTQSGARLPQVVTPPPPPPPPGGGGQTP